MCFQSTKIYPLQETKLNELILCLHWMYRENYNLGFGYQAGHFELMLALWWHLYCYTLQNIRREKQRIVPETRPYSCFHMAIILDKTRLV